MDKLGLTWVDDFWCGIGGSISSAIFMYQFSFTRGQLGLGSAAAMMMLATVVAVLVPVMYLEARSARSLR